jgi:glucosamine-6-phosphate deaminase
MFKTIVCKNYDEVSSEAFKVMKEVLDSEENPVLGLATGSTPVGLYKNMIKDHKDTGRSYKNILTFNLDEYVGLPKTHEQSYWTFMHENLFDYLDCPEENIHVPSGEGEDPQKNADEYEEELKKHTVSIQVLGIGSDGHIAFNEPGTPFDSLTHLADLTQQTINDNARFFEGDITKVPTKAVTMGLGSIMRSKKIILIATGANKADAVYGMLKGEKTIDCPASILQDHADVTVIMDEAASSKL